MKHATGPRRGRPRGNGKRFSPGGGKNQSFESTGPDVKIRGTAQQVYEKYLSLARDALSAGDRISAEGFFQFADHYYRIVNAANGNNQARNDRGPRIPPPPESGRIVIDDGSAMPSDQSMGENAEGDGEHLEPAREPAPAPVPEPAPVSASAYDEEQPRQGDLYTRDAAPASQAEELAEALARADSAGSHVAEPAQQTEPTAPAEAEEAASEEPPVRRSRLGSRRASARRSQPAEAVAVATERAEAATTSTATAEAKPVKRGRGRPRKTVAKSEESASETA